MRNLIIFYTFFCLTVSCNKKKFFTKKISNNGWELNQILNSNNQVIINKPDSINSKIYFVFTSDHRVIGHTPTQIISSKYSIKKNKEFLFNDLEIKGSNFCCEWERYFIENYSLVDRYIIDDNENLNLLFGNNKMIFIKN